MTSKIKNHFTIETMPPQHVGRYFKARYLIRQYGAPLAQRAHRMAQILMAPAPFSQHQLSFVASTL